MGFKIGENKRNKLFVVGAVAIVLGLFLGVGGYKVWTLMFVRTRPWHLEAYFQSQLADCETGPSAFLFRKELEQLAARAQKAELCLLETDKKLWLYRDYSECVSMLLYGSFDAQRLSLKIVQRQQEQKEKLDVLLATLSPVLGKTAGNEKVWAKFNLPSIEQARAKSLFEQAEFLSTHGEVESALSSVLRAWVSWNHFSHQSDAKFARFEDTAMRRKWDQQVEQLLSWTKRSGRRAILVDKLEHLCLLLDRGKVHKRYSANLGRKWYQRKVQSMDASTPEGEYKVERLIPSGKYGFALLIDYPNSTDRARFLALQRDGTIPNEARIGGNIEIHGRGRPAVDWTDGCISLKDDDMRELYRLCYIGMPVTIVGTSTWTSKLMD